MADAPFRTSPSAIARYFFHDCERFFRFLSAGPERRTKEGLPEVAFDHSPLIRALLDSGHAWEETILDRHPRGDVLVAPGDGPRHARRFDWQQTLALLRTAPPDAMIYQPTLRLPQAFYDRYGIDSRLVAISDNHPDLIAVLRGDDGRRVLRMIDVKRGEALQMTHRVQVLLYALELDAVLADRHVDDVRVDLTTGAVWLGQHDEPTPFALDDLRPHVEAFLRQDLVRILRAAPEAARWHVRARCEWCEFFRHCWGEMQRADDLSRLPRLSSWGKRFLTERAGVRTTAELGEFLQRPEADETLDRCASLAGGRPRLAQQVAALSERRPQLHGASSPTLSRGENIGLFLTLQQEPLGESIYLAGMYVTARQDLRQAVFSDEVCAALFDRARSRPWVAVAARPDDVDAVRRGWVRLLHDVIVQVDRYNRDRPWNEQLSLQAYVLSEQERALAVAWLLESLRDPELSEQAMTLLFHFQAPELMAADEHPDREVPFPLVVLLDALSQVLALPVEVDYTLPEALIALGSRSALRRNEYFDFPLGAEMRAEPIHAAWRRGQPELLDEIIRQAAARLQAGRSLLQSLRQTAAPAIFTWSAKFTLPAREEFADSRLSRLAFFARYESLLRCLDVRNMRCEPRAVQLLLGKALELEALGDDRFRIVAGAMEIDAGGYPEWLLVRDDAAGRQAQLEFRDYACRARLWQRQQAELALVGVAAIERDPLDAPTTLTLDYCRGFDGPRARPGERFLLHPRFTDFTTDGVVKFLRERPVATHALLCDLLGDPQAIAQLQPLDEPIRRDALERIGAFALTASQRQAFAQICQRRVTPIWGPPGTGKTHFLAAMIRALGAAHARAGRPFRVLVTAFTHAAIENLLTKIAAGRDASPAASPELRVGKAKIWQGGHVDGIETVDEAELSAWLDAHPCAVVGATVYSCLKQYDRLPPFDLCVIDEASQVRVPEAAVPIALAGREGRVVLAGDHLQLPPIIAGVYPETEPGEPALHRSIFEALAHSSQPTDGRRPPLADGPAAPCPAAPCPAPARAAAQLEQLTENFRMNDVLTSFAAGLLYGSAYRPHSAAVADRRLNLLAQRCLDPLVEACLDPAYPLVFVVLDGVWAARENPPEAELAAQLVAALRGTLQQHDGSLFADDAAFFRDGVFVVSPHRAQIRAIQRELRRQRRWQAPPLVDTVDKIQGREADAVVVSYGVSDPEFAAQEAEFIYGLNRLNVAVTRARAKCVVCLPRPLLDAPPQVLELPEAGRGLAFMRELVQAVSHTGEQSTFELEDGVRATVYRTRRCWERPNTTDREATNRVATNRIETTDAAIENTAMLEEPMTDVAMAETAMVETAMADAAAALAPTETAIDAESFVDVLTPPIAARMVQPYAVSLRRVTIEIAEPEPAALCAAESAGRYQRGGRNRQANQQAKAATTGSRSASADEQKPTAGPRKPAPAGRSSATDPRKSERATDLEPPPGEKPAKRAKPAKPAATAKPQGRADTGAPEQPPSGLLAHLNDAQRAAACHGMEPLLIIAGAGTGKTTTLVYRVAQQIAQGVPAERILLLSFTRRAAFQMIQRVAAVLSDADAAPNVWGGTFHGVATRLLRQYGPAIGVHPRFTIYDQGDAEDLMGALCRELDLDTKDKTFPKKRACLAIHSYGVNAEVPLDDVLVAQHPQFERHAAALQRLFAAYTQRKAELHVFDYDDLLRKWCDLLDHEQVGPKIRGRFELVLVDEYQDTNRLQARLLGGLRPDGRGLTVVGDDAQSIYSFRAATVRNILDFPRQFPGAQIIKLEQNYRSTQPILTTTNGVIAQAAERYEKELWSSRTAGPPPQLVTCEDEFEQVEFVTNRILEHQRQGIPLAQQAVLFRASHHSIQLEGQLARLGIEFVKYGGLKFVEAAHVKDLLSLLRLAENPRDTVSGARALCLLPGIGPKKAQDLLRELAAADGQFDVWRDAKAPAKSKEIWPEFVRLMSWLGQRGAGEDLGEQVRRASKFYEPLLEQAYDNPAQRLADLEELNQLAAHAPDRATLLADLTVDPPAARGELRGGPDRDQTLTLSTLHSAKGLEWRVVYVLHASDGKIPLERASFDFDQLEEERRIFYVALTRAADWLYVCYPRHEAAAYGYTSRSGWGGDMFESCRLTRFITKAVKASFQCQNAATFQPPTTASAEGKTTRRRSRKG